MIDDIAILRAVHNDIASRLADVGELMTAAVARAAPKDSSELVKSIRYVVDRQNLQVKIVVDAFYSAFIEFGFRHRIGKKSLVGKKKKKRLGYSKLSREQSAAGEYKEIAPKPFLRPTVYANLKKAIEILEGPQSA